ncbi:MAG: (2Fe-2S)-binding protein, partial [Nitrospinota bacterium]
TVLVDGRTARSCLMFAVQAEGCEVRTVEGLAPAGGLHPLQEAFHERHALQCGFCTPGMLMSACELLERDPQADEAAVRKALAGNLCMCTGYVNIVRAVLDAAGKMRRDGPRPLAGESGTGGS